MASRFGIQGGFFFGKQDATASSTASGTANGTSVLFGNAALNPATSSGRADGTATVTGNGRVVKVGSGNLLGTASATGNARSEKIASGTLAGTSIAQAASGNKKIASGTLAGTSIAQAAGENKKIASGTAPGTSTLSGNGVIAQAVITNVTPSSPEEGQVNVIIDGSGFDGTFTYAGIPLSVVSWTPTQATVNFPVIATDFSNVGFNQDYPLIAKDSDPFQVQTSPRSNYQYVLIGARDDGLDPGEGLFDDDTLGTGDNYVYGVESPVDGQWDFTGLANHYINSVPDGGTFAYRLWDVDLQQWSQIANESFQVGLNVLPASGTAAGQSTAVVSERMILSASGDLFGQGSASASARGPKEGSGTAAGTSSLAGAAGRIIRLFGTAAGASTVTGNAVRLIEASGRADGTSALSAVTRVGKFGSGQADGSATVRAGPYIENHPVVIAAGVSMLTGNGIIRSDTIGPIEKPGFVSISPKYGIRGS